MGKKKNKGGRPSKKDKFDAPDVERFGKLGLTDKQIALLYDVSEVTINNWKYELDGSGQRQETKFFKALKRGKDNADNKVVEALYNRAIGFTKNKTYYPPEPKCIWTWLNNRRPEEWRDRRKTGLEELWGKDSDKKLVWNVKLMEKKEDE